MRGGFRTRSDGQFVAQSPKASQNEIPKQDIADTAASKGATAGQNSSAIPSISLPKGGGAIRGIGEKFAANPVTGTGSLNVPISTTPGRSGFGPQLALSYDSGSGNGPFGFGWSLSIPSITRKTAKGLPKYQDADESDVFILSGAEDLVPVLVEENNMPDRIIDGVQYKIKQYRPRIEGLFARIEQWTNTTSGEMHWRSISQDNITTLYGKTDENRIGDLGDTADSKRVFSWLICESYDDKGNAIRYEYKAENSQGVDLSVVHERNRTEATRSNNRYLKRIKYGNKTPRLPNEDLSARNDWMFEAVFDYGEHYTEDDQGQPTSVSINDDKRTWEVRQDPFSAYHAGFEVRTYRLCQRVLMFHHFPDELDTEDYLVRSTEFVYDESTLASFITKAIQSGYVHRTDGTYLKKSVPPLEFEYSQVTIQEEIKEIDSESLENLPYGLDGQSYRWVDLDGEGLSGILTEQADTWLYKPNQGAGKFGALQVLAEKPSLANLSSGRQQLMDLAGDGQLDLVQLSGPVPGFYERNHDQYWKQFTPFDSLPNVDWNDPNLKFVDLTGDGHADILITEDQAFTWYLSLAEAGFSQGEKVRQALDEETGPRLVFADGTQSIYLSDLSGDGLTDLVRIRNGEVCYWPNLGYGQFGAKVTMDNSPWFDNPDQFNQQRIRLADIDGSGTTDIIYLVSDGVHIYFNQSGNKWSEKQTLNQFPHIDNMSSVMMADLMGNGTACLLWSSPLPGNAQQQMRYIDLMGGQKPHLLVGVKNNLGAETRVHYVPSTKFYTEDRKEGKPWITRIPFPVHVVEQVEVYDWISRNRFVTRYAYHHGYFDGIEREFRGFGMVEQWDTEEIGTVGSEATGNEDTNWDKASFVPPVLTKTWFHTGAYLAGGRISKQFEDEYYREGDPSLGEGELSDEELQAMLLQDTVLPDDLPAEEIHEACRSLKGGILRQEIYALDCTPDGNSDRILTEKSDRPYTVSECNYTIKHLQPRGENKHAVFFVHPRETVDFHYERKLVDVGGKKQADPRISHEMTLKVDDFGNVERSVAIGYPRRAVPDRQPEQEETHITFTVNRFINSPDNQDWYRAGLPAETQTYEIVHPPEPAVLATSVALFKIETLRTLTENLFPLDQNEPDTLKTHPYEKWNWRSDTDTPSETKLRLIEQVRTLYRRNDLSGFLLTGQVDSLALPGETYKLAFTPGLLETVYKRPGEDPENLLPDSSAVLGSKEPDGGGYVDLDGNGNWWVPSGRIFYWQNLADNPVQELDFAHKHFFLPHRFSDPFGNNTIVAYDDYEIDTGKNYNLLLTETRDPLDNMVSSQNDYRVLQPALVTDPNDNRSAVAFDALGMVVGTAVMGKSGENKGDSLTGFKSDLSEITILNHIQDPLANPHDILQKATTRLVYDLFPYYRTRDDIQPQPAIVYTLARETHDADLEPGKLTKIQHSFSYSDGFEREIQKKIQAEPGDVDGVQTDPRWVGSGWTIFNNKGKPVRQYEPFFDDSHEFRFGKEVGVSSILFYDPVERVVATLHPNNTYEKVVFDPWHQKTYDVNDTVASDPRTDPDISGYVAGYFEQIALEPDTWETWLQQRGVDPLNPPEDVPGLDSEKKAAVRTLVHADTPTTAFSDSLGRTFLTIDDNGPGGQYPTRVDFDIEGNTRLVTDALDNPVMVYAYSIVGPEEEDEEEEDEDEDEDGEENEEQQDSHLIYQNSMDAGERWMLNNVTGNPIYTWDSRGHVFRTEYDPLRRPLSAYVKGADLQDPDREILSERTIYGESHPDSNSPTPGKLNLRNNVFMQLDGAGIIINMAYNPQTDEDEAYDFKGNLLRTTRQLALEYKQHVDWSAVEPLLDTDLLDLPAVEAALVPLLEAEIFTNSTTYDALNRPIQIVAPHSSGARTKLNVTQPVYNEANLLEGMEVWLEQDAEPDGLLDPDTATQHTVRNIDYNAKGQRDLIEYGNGVKTTYEYDDKTFRLIHLLTLRGTEPLQDMCYTYDPIGNITAIRDDAQQTIYFNGQVVRPDVEYTYDAIYRLIEATGREHIGQVSQPHTTWNDKGRVNLAHPNDGQAMRNYFEFYEYDEVGNILRFDHKAHNGNWIRAYEYNEANLIEPGKKNNRLSGTIVHPNGQQPIPELYTYDPHGNMTSMPHLKQMDWDFEDQLHSVEKGSEKIYYIYDAAGERMRKVVEKNNGTLIQERIYLGGFEIYHKHSGSGLTLQRETLHVMDDEQRIAMVETKTHDKGAPVPVPTPLTRYQLGNHLGSVSLELDGSGAIISYEEYHPYGTTAYHATRSGVEVSPKRYRYTGKERDDETGLNYHGARYYAPWLGRWASVDPEGLVDDANMFIYVSNNPIRFIDKTGNDKSEDKKSENKKIVDRLIHTGLKEGSESVLKRTLYKYLSPFLKNVLSTGLGQLFKKAVPTGLPNPVEVFLTILLTPSPGAKDPRTPIPLTYGSGILRVGKLFKPSATEPASIVMKRIKLIRREAKEDFQDIENKLQRVKTKVYKNLIARHISVLRELRKLGPKHSRYPLLLRKLRYYKHLKIYPIFSRILKFNVIRLQLKAAKRILNVMQKSRKINPQQIQELQKLYGKHKFLISCIYRGKCAVKSKSYPLSFNLRSFIQRR